MRLYLIRHCESENNALWKRTGSSEGRSDDPLLTEKGEHQARVLAEYLASAARPSAEPFAGGPLRGGLTLTHLYSSLMRRAIQTGLPIARALDLPLVAWTELHERGGIYLTDPQTGKEQGLPGPGRSFFEGTYPDLVLPEALDEGGWWKRPYEDRQMALARAAGVLEQLLARHGESDDHVGFITHGGFTQSILQALFGFCENGSNIAGGRFVWIKINNGAITRIDLTGDLLRLAYQNYIDYMPGDLLT